MRIEEIIKDYKREWEFINEQINIKELPIKDWVTSDKFVEIYTELRLIVDELMRIEYELLQKALAKDKKKKYKPPKKKKGKGKKKKGKKKKKEPKDITGHRLIESIYYEMEDSGLIRKYKKHTFDEWIGEYNYCAYDLRNYMLRDSIAAKGEIRDIIREYILGLGPLDITKPKSLIIAGPANSGKKLLLDIIATEIG